MMNKDPKTVSKKAVGFLRLSASIASCQLRIASQNASISVRPGQINDEAIL